MAKKSNKKNTVVLILIVLLLLIGIIFQKTKKQTQFEPYFIGAINRIEPKVVEKDNLNTIVKEEVGKLEGSWGIAIRDLKTGKTYLYNADKELASASLYKLAVMWAAYQAIEDGQIKEEDFQNQLNAMITYSDNDSAIYLAETLGWQNIEKLMVQEGLSGFKLNDPPRITAQSTLDLLERIYANTAVSQEASLKMKSFLFAQTVNDRIPKYLPKDVKVAHKTGELDFLRHDAGIVIGKNSHYIFVFLSETPIPEEASEQIALLSKKIYDQLELQ